MKYSLGLRLMVFETDRPAPKNAQDIMEMVFPHLYPAKNKGVTTVELQTWLAKNGYCDPMMIWDKTEKRMLVQVNDFDGNHKTYIMSVLLQMIEEGR